MGLPYPFDQIWNELQRARDRRITVCQFRVTPLALRGVFMFTPLLASDYALLFDVRTQWDAEFQLHPDDYHDIIRARPEQSGWAFMHRDDGQETLFGVRIDYSALCF